MEVRSKMWGKDSYSIRLHKRSFTTVTNYTYDNGNQLASVNGQAYTYDANGSLTNNGAKTFVYNEVNQLTQVKNSGGSVIASFTYDDQGRRISSTVSGTTYQYHYSGDKVIYITDGNNNILNEFSYDPQGNPATMAYNGATYYYHVDGHGNITALTDASGNTAAQYTYDAWGNILTQSGTVASTNPLRYSGYMYDGATGLYYLMARYYDPGVGRFITRDTFHGFENEPQSLNQYAYCHNNPVVYVDPSGYAGISNSALALGIDVAIVVITGSVAPLIGLKAVRNLIRANRGFITRVVEKQIMKYIGTKASIFAATVFNLALTVTGASIGGIIAFVIDHYIDPRLGFKKNNSRSFG